MKRLGFAIIPAAFLVLCSPIQAQVQTPKVIQRMTRIDRSSEQVFGTLKRYFSELSSFTLVSADESAGTIVARRQGIDIGTWNRWAYCKVEPLQLLDTLLSSTATVNVKVQRSGNSASYVTVTANLDAVYGIGSQRDNVQCISNGTLESEISAVAGAGTQRSGN